VSTDGSASAFEIETENGHQIITARGDIDMATAAQFRRHVESATEPLVVVDLAEVTYIDSAGIHAVDRSVAALIERHQQVRIVVPTGSPVEWTFKVAGFDSGNFFPSITDALG
jgi:anti-anti-sigma factor